MRKQYRIEDLIALGVESSCGNAIIGKGPTRKIFSPDERGVIFDLERQMDEDERLKIAALLAALEKGAKVGDPTGTGDDEVKDEPEVKTETEEKPKPKRTRKKAEPKAEEG